MRILAACLLLLWPLLAQEAPCLPKEPGRCAGCHVKDLATVFPARATRPCVAYCTHCHFKDNPKVHHPVGQSIRRPPGHEALRLADDRMSCATCHDVGKPREDSRRWKATSFFERAFRRRERHPTYLLVMPNDRGQLCKSCH